ncbi:MAG: glycosyltransferase family 9 protein [Candidatus Coatesbacteria bacterium]|nr:glycosyltransferase family 9 protein [Candidatus Coatesbacteria bacterium]
MTWTPKADCRHYLGDRPCRFRRTCPDCPNYAPRGAEVLVIKLAALGDVLRTCALLPALRRRHGDDAFITWVTGEAARPLVANQPLVDRALPLDVRTLAALRGRFFEAVYVLDKEDHATGLGLMVEAGERYGFVHGRRGELLPVDETARYYWTLGLDDEEKFQTNQLSYQQLLANALGLDWRGERYALRPSQVDKERAAGISGGFAEGRPLVGLNVGAGGVFAHKNWPARRYAELIDARPDWRFLLLGGPREAGLLAELEAASNARSAGADNPLLTFAALIERCAAVVSGDTLGLHVALAVGTPVVALFGPTCRQEIELYGRGVKLVSPADCAPCYRRRCDVSPSCMERIGLAEVLSSLEELLERDAPA